MGSSSVASPADHDSGARNDRASDLEILDERILYEVPRGRDGREVLRLRHVRARTPEDRAVAWHDVRIFVRGSDGKFYPTGKGISIRGSELHGVAAMLTKAASGTPAPLERPATRRPQQLRTPPPPPPAAAAAEPYDGPPDEEIF